MTDDDQTTTTDATTDTKPAGVASGILDAERRARDEVSRRRRLLVGGGVLGLVVALAVLAVMTILQQQANQEAQREAARLEAKAGFAESVVDRAEDYELPATAIAMHAADLRSTLEQFLTTTTTTDVVLQGRVDDLTGRLDRTAAEVEDLRDREVAEPSELIDPVAAVAVLRELEGLRAEAGALAEEVPAATADVATWVEAVRAVNEAVAEHVAQVEAEEPTSNPEELIALWQAERPALVQLRAAAAAAADIPGLEQWAAAHTQYVDDLLAWIDEAIDLLEEGDLETYNTRFDEEFGTDDPFGFSQAVAAATPAALDSPALQQLDTVEQRADLVLQAITTTEMTTADELDDDARPAT